MSGDCQNENAENDYKLKEKELNLKYENKSGNRQLIGTIVGVLGVIAALLIILGGMASCTVSENRHYDELVSKGFTPGEAECSAYMQGGNNDCAALHAQRMMMEQIKINEKGQKNES